MKTLVLLASSLLLAGCGARTLPDLPPPNVAAPAAKLAEPGPIREGFGRIQIETTNGPARVDLVSNVNPRLVWLYKESHTSGSYRYTTYEQKPDSDVRMVPLCQTPCVVDLPVGTYRARYETVDGEPRNVEQDDLVVTSTPKIHRRAVGTKAPIVNTIMAWTLPPLLLAPGLAFAGVGTSNLITSGDADGDRQARLRTQGAAAIGVGVVLLAAGIYVTQLIRPTEQQGGAVERAR